MVALTHLFHLWVRVSNVMFLPISYVGNWAVLLQSPSAMQQACDAVDKFAALLDIRLEAQKSFTWSTDQAGRHELRSAVFRVVNATWDLGAHVAYTRQLSNHTTLDRFRDLADFCSASCTFKQKRPL